MAVDHERHEQAEGAEETALFRLETRAQPIEVGIVSGSQGLQRANERLRESEERYRTLFRLVPVAVYACDATGMIREFNQRAAELWGREPERGNPREKFCGSFKIFYPDGRFMPHEECPMASVLRGDAIGVNDAEILVERPDGSRRNVIAHPQPLKNDRGEIIGAVNCLYDITEHRQAEEAARESERRFREMIDALPVAIYTTDAEGRLTHFNPAAVAFSGRVPEMGTDSWCVTWKLYYPDGTPMPHDECPMAIALKEGRVIHGAEAIAERPDGTRVWFTPYPTPLRDAKGRIIGGINMLLDITERKQAEETRARLAAIVESSDDAIISKDLNGVITSWNEGAERLFGYTAREAIGEPITMLIPPDRQDEEPAILARIRHGERIEHFETVRRRKDGMLLDISLTISPIVDSWGTVVGASKIARDITAQRALARQKDEFLGIASHELKTPVTGIKGYAQLLERRFRAVGDATATGMLGKLGGQIDKLTGLIEDLLDVTRIESGKLPFRPAPFDLNELIVEIIEEIQRTTDRHVIVSEFAASVTLVADRERVGQVLTNLLTNAIKYSPQADRIVVRTARDGESIVTFVQDFGIGIPARMRPHVFDRFFRVDGEARAGYSGLGLGLYIAAEFVRRHGGAIWVESEEGKGTTMAFSLPLNGTHDTREDRRENTT
jgi:PAS domain S-box-containing protein